jgi:hypothetical protein
MGVKIGDRIRFVYCYEVISTPEHNFATIKAICDGSIYKGQPLTGALPAPDCNKCINKWLCMVGEVVQYDE